MVESSARAAARDAALGAALTEQLGEPVEVTIVGAASTGATRRTLFADTSRGGATDATVITVNSPTMATLTVDDEWWCLQAAAGAGMPVAEPVARGAGSEDIGGPFLVTRRVDGETVPRRVLRSLVDDAHAGALTDQLATALAALHQADVSTAPLPRFNDSAAYMASMKPTFDQLPQKSPALALGYRWLIDHPIEQTQTALVHGDYRLGNFIVDEGGLAAVLDWELAHVGDPMEDVAWLCLRSWRFGNDDLLVGGFGRLDDFARSYEAAGGLWRPDALYWWLVARTWWWGVMLALQASAFVAGLTDAIVLAASGRRVAELEYDLLALLRRAQ